MASGRFAVAALSILILAASAHGAERGWVAVDGDTLRNTLTQERVRVLGLDTPELKGACARERQLAQAARNMLANLIRFGGDVTLERMPAPDRYGRVLARVRVAGHDVAPQLVEAGLARPYAGGKREGWCTWWERWLD